MNHKCVIDTDCLFFLANSRIGRKYILENCSLFLPQSILHELNQKEQNILENGQLEIINLEKRDKKNAGKYLQHLTGRKQIKKNYLQGKCLRRIKNIGECEGAAIAKRLDIDLVLLDQNAYSILKKLLRFSGVKVKEITEFGLEILKKYRNAAQIPVFKKELEKILHKKI